MVPLANPRDLQQCSFPKTPLDLLRNCSSFLKVILLLLCPVMKSRPRFKFLASIIVARLIFINILGLISSTANKIRNKKRFPMMNWNIDSHCRYCVRAALAMIKRI